MTGKRNRDTAVVSRSTNTKDDSPPPVDAPAANAQDVFRKYFEAQFEPLDLPEKSTNDSSSEEDDSQDDGELSESGLGWDGLSEASEDENQVEVVEHKATELAPSDRMDKKARKAFMVGIPHKPRINNYSCALIECQAAVLPRQSRKETDQVR